MNWTTCGGGRRLSTAAANCSCLRKGPLDNGGGVKAVRQPAVQTGVHGAQPGAAKSLGHRAVCSQQDGRLQAQGQVAGQCAGAGRVRSEERRVGKEWSARGACGRWKKK